MSNISDIIRGSPPFIKICAIPETYMCAHIQQVSYCKLNPPHTALPLHQNVCNILDVYVCPYTASFVYSKLTPPFYTQPFPFIKICAIPETYIFAHIQQVSYSKLTPLPFTHSPSPSSKFVQYQRCTCIPMYSWHSCSKLLNMLCFVPEIN